MSGEDDGPAAYPDEVGRQLIGLMTSDQHRANPKYAAVQAMLGMFVNLDTSLSASMTATTKAIIGDMEAVAVSSKTAYDARVQFRRYMLAWVKAELGEPDGGA